MLETRDSPHTDAGDTSISLRDYLSAAIDAQKEHHELQCRVLEQRMDHLEQSTEHRMKALEASLDARFDALGTASALALHSNEQAILKSDVQTERRFASVNEFRLMLNDVLATSMPRAEADSRMKLLEEGVTENKERLNVNQGTGQGMKSSWLFLVGLIAALAGSASIVLVLMSGGA